MRSAREKWFVLTTTIIFARTLVNKTIRQFAESLLIYRDMVRDFAADGDNASADGELSEQLRKQLHQKLKKIDPAAMKTQPMNSSVAACARRTFSRLSKNVSATGACIEAGGICVLEKDQVPVRSQF